MRSEDMERMITKKELKAIRKVLSMNRFDFADFVGVSESHIAKSEGRHKNAYQISEQLDKRIKNKLESINVSLEEVLSIAKKEGWIK